MRRPGSASGAVLRFPLDKRHGTETLASCLAPLGEVRAGAPLRVECIMKDSFDWRLYRAGCVVEEIRREANIHTVLRNIQTGDVLADFPGVAPAFARDFAAGHGREYMASLLKMRALLPVVRMQSRMQEMRLLNRDEKTVVRVRIEQHHAGRPGDQESIPMGRYLHIAPVRGYDKQIGRVRKHLAKALDMNSHLPVRLYDLALAAIDRQAMDYSSSLDIDLASDMPAHLAARKILHALFDTMEANEDGLMADADTEFLHDFRVAIRRTRSALAQIRGVLPQQVLERFRPEFAWLCNITTPVRDLDVYLLNFDAYQQALPACMQGDLEPLRVFLTHKRKQAQQTLMRRLRSAHCHRLKQDWRNFLDHGSPDESVLLKSSVPITEVAGRRISRLFRRALREGGAIHRDSPPEALHELRKTCKKLRYLMEFFRRLYPRHKIAALIRDLKQLQDNLGVFQDLAVQCASLQETCREMKMAESLPETSGRAMEMLLDELCKRQDKSRKAFAGCFEMFSSAKNRRRIKRMFGRMHA